MKRLIAIICCLVFFQANAQFQPSPVGHYLLRDGKNFFWLGDTGPSSGYGQDWVLILANTEKDYMPN